MRGRLGDLRFLVSQLERVVELLGQGPLPAEARLLNGAGWYAPQCRGLGADLGVELSATRRQSVHQLEHQCRYRLLLQDIQVAGDLLHVGVLIRVAIEQCAVLELHAAQLLQGGEQGGGRANGGDRLQSHGVEVPTLLEGSQNVRQVL